MKLPNKLFLAFLLLSTIDYRLSTHCFSQEDNTAKANEHFLAGNKLLEAGNYADADAEFKKAQDLLKAQPRVLPAPAKSAPIPEAPSKQPQPAKAESRKAQPELKLPQEYDPGRSGIFLPPGNGKPPRNPSLHYNLAIAYLQTKQYPRAAEAFKKGHPA